MPLPSKAEPDLLLRELIHRIKNSLTIISSIANLESQAITDPGAQEIIQRLRNRVTATALLYDLLAKGGEPGSIQLGAYLGDLAELLIDSLAAEPSRLKLDLDVETLAVSP